MRSRDAMDVEVVLNRPTIIGASSAWLSADGSICRIDSKAPALQRQDRKQRLRTRQFKSDAGAVLALRTGLFDLERATGETGLFAPSPFDPALSERPVPEHPVSDQSAWGPRA